ncbi:MAG TPA: helix-turn-helix transcriptional regulator [Microlunatus sp.]|nr:helix-turn-helix transcriptional regulator [Microlunatus sp.]
MRDGEMLRLSLDCARLAVQGGDFAPILAEGADSIMRADAAAAFITVPLVDCAAGSRPRVVVAGGPPVDDSYISDLIELAPRHPHTARPGWFDAPTTRLSDLVDLPRFWETDLWQRFHGYVNGRYQCAANLGCHGGTAAFLVVQRVDRDFSDDDLAVLDLIRGPLIPAQAFRAAWDAATAQVRRTVGAAEAPLTAREEQVVGLVALGWTSARIGRHLHITERTVRKHLENINGKLGTTNRAAAVNRFRGLDPAGGSRRAGQR